MSTKFVYLFVIYLEFIYQSCELPQTIQQRIVGRRVVMSLEHGMRCVYGLM